MAVCKGIEATTLNDMGKSAVYREWLFDVCGYFLDILSWGRIRYIYNVILMILAI